MRTKSIGIGFFLTLFVISHEAYADGYCLEMMNASWNGTYHWSYRGDDYEVPMQIHTEYLSPNKYIMRATLLGSNPETLTFNGNCMHSQIYFEANTPQSPIYLQGTIEGNMIHLTGQRGPFPLKLDIKKI